VEYCPTLEMFGDYMSKPLQGKLFVKFKSLIVGSEVVLPLNVKASRSVLADLIVSVESNELSQVMYIESK
jgi:hypothetical protein